MRERKQMGGIWLVFMKFQTTYGIRPRVYFFPGRQCLLALARVGSIGMYSGGNSI